MQINLKLFKTEITFHILDKLMVKMNFWVAGVTLLANGGSDLQFELMRMRGMSDVTSYNQSQCSIYWKMLWKTHYYFTA